MHNLIDDLLMLTDQEVDYKALSDEVLEQLALESDPFIANGALTELGSRNSQIALEAAQEVLARATDEPYLQASALRIVFANDRAKALDYMLGRGATAHPLMLNALLEMLMYESDFRYELQLAHIAKRQIAGREEEMGDDLDPNTVADFMQLMR